MTRRLGGIEKKSLAALASLSLAATLACGFAMMGCGGGDSTPSTEEAGTEGGGFDAGVEAALPDRGVPVEAGPDVTLPTPCATPVFAPAMGTVAAGTAVTITSANLPANGFIFFTTDMTVPTHNSPAYSVPTVVNQTVTIRAMAYAAGACSDSATATAVYTVPMAEAGPPDVGVDAPPTPACATPTFAPTPGTFTTNQNVTISTTTANATIFYTKDTTNPTPASPVYASPIAVGQTTTIRAICTAPGFVASLVGVGMYTINIPPGTVAPPVPTPSAGTLSNAFNVTMTSATTGATICYAFNTSHPTCTNGVCGASSTNYGGAGVPIDGTVSDAATGQVIVNAIACLAGSTNSTEVSQTYTLQAAAPQFIPGPATLAYTGAGAGGTTANPSVSTATNGTDVQIRYTVGTAVPTCQTATLLAGPYPATLPVSQTITYNAIACKPGFAQSTVTTAAYIVQANAPTFSITGGLFDNTVSPVLALAAAEPTGSWICYSTTGQAACGAAPGGCVTPTSINPATTPPVVTENGTVIDALTCAPAGFLNSGHVQSGSYMLQLAPLTFSPTGGSLGTGAMQTVTIAKSVTNPAGIDYTGICHSNDGTTPACSTTSDTACATNGGTFTGGNSATETADATHLTIKAIACPGTQVADPNDGFVASTPGSAVFSPAGTLTAPTIHPGTSTQNNTVAVTFDNTNAVPVQICYSKTGAPALNAGTCTPTTAATVCVAATASQAGVAAATVPLVTLNQTTVQAVACDLTQASATSPPNSATYTLQEATPTITPNAGMVSVGSVITFLDATAGTSFHYVTNGGAVTCALGSGTTVAAGSVNAQGLYPATYTIQGNETTIVVIACDATGNFIPSASSATATFSYSVVTPTYLFPTGTYDDLLDGTAGAGTTEQVQVQAGSTFGGTTWLCSGATPACGATAGVCSTGAAVTVGAACTNALPGACFDTPVSASPTTINVVACALPSAGAVLTPAVIQSAAASATLTLVMSPIAFTPAPGTVTGTVTPIAHLTGGAIVTPSAITTSGTVVSPTPVLICMSSTQPVPPQPVPNCAAFAGLPADWTCATVTAGNPVTVTGAAITTNTSFNAFACKDGIPYATSSGNAYNFTVAPPYSHTITMNGLVTDFTAAAEQIGAGAAPRDAYVSYNGTNLWVGFNSPNVTGPTVRYVHFYIGGAAGGTSTADTVGGLNLGGTLPAGFRGLYHVYWRNDGAATAVNQFNGAVWATSAIAPTVVYNGGASTFVEFQIPLASIGNPTDIHLLGGVSLSPGTGAAGAFDVWPRGGPNLGNVNGANFTDWQTELLNTAAHPNATANLSVP